MEHRTELTNAALNGEMLNLKDSKQLLRKLSLQQNSNNSIFDPSEIMSANTVKKYEQMHAIPVAAAVKNHSRVEAFKNIRNALSFCGLAGAIHLMCAPEVTASSDDTSLLINQWGKPICITTEEALTFLREHNISPAVTMEALQQRVITFNCTMTAFQLVCKVTKFADRKFSGFLPVNKPRVFKLPNHMYVILYSPENVDDTTLNLAMYELCIIPEVIALRNRKINESIEGLKEISFANRDGAATHVLSGELCALFFSRLTF